ncbi:MAG: NUDIX domain-containing protein [Candidatus Sungbacteria bacterium]|nr:NUDIX domain-containing protein [Candidatus Sungbacteria bacterium]
MDLKRGIEFIGVNCIFFCHDGAGKFLLHKRGQDCRDEKGAWDCGAGAMEFGESFEETISREVWEEYRVKPIDIRYIDSKNVIREHNGRRTHWIGNLHLVRIDPARAIIGEPSKIDEIGWFSLDDLPHPLHSQLQNDIAMVKKFLGL